MELEYLKPQWVSAHAQLTLYLIQMPLKYHVFENIMENGAFAPEI